MKHSTVKDSTTTQRVYRFFKMLALISFVSMFGSCVACHSTTEVKYGEEELYRAYDGKIKLGAKNEFSGGDPYRAIAVFSLVVFLISGVGFIVTFNKVHDVKKDDWEDDLHTLTIEQLEKRLVELPRTTRGLAKWQIAVRRKVITDMIDKRRNSPIDSE